METKWFGKYIGIVPLRELLVKNLGLDQTGSKVILPRAKWMSICTEDRYYN
jgi:hypothetical protein